MAALSPIEFSTDGGAVIELDEEIDGDEIGSRNYRFSKIGEPVPVSTDGTSEFEPQSLPSRPLAVSERFRLLFVAHPQGFYVVRTKDVMASAEEIKEKKMGRSVQELSLVDVPIGKVSILALSADDSLLAATVSSHVHFFAVSALLHKEQKPSYSVSLDDSICIKDVLMARKVAKAYLILSSNGKLYHGSGQGPLVYIMEGVDSVDWSIKGNHIAVAKKNVVSILSSHFKEKLRFFLSFQSVIGDSDTSQAIRVDSIRWIRPDSIAVGCFQINNDGEEENYIVQVITSRGRRFTDVSEALKPIVLSFSNVFMDFYSDAVPTRNGPHLFLSYLDLYGLAFVANRNLSRQVALFSWQDNGKNEAAMVEILDDAWILHIDSQDNGDENVIVGLSVDKVSQNENVKFTLGNEEREVSPCCVIICLTIDGRISVFHHFTSNAGTLASLEGSTSGEEDDASQVSVEHELSQISSAGTNEIREPTFSASQSHEDSRIVVEKTSPNVTTANDLSPSFNVDIRPRDKSALDNMGHKPLANSETLKVDDPEKALSIVQSQDSNAHNKSISEAKNSKGFFSGNMAGDVSRQPVTNYTLLGSNVEPLHKATPPENAPSLWSLTRSNARVDASNTSDGMFLSLSSGEVDNSDKHTSRSAGSLQKHPTDLKEKPSVNFTNPSQTAMTARGNRNSQPAYVGSQVPLGNNFASGKSFQSDFKKEINATSSPLAIHFGQHASKQFGNVEEMAKKLDTLLEGIEGKAGFIDASITSQKDSVIELEEGIWALSDRCRVQRGLINEQQRELQLLLDKTVEVLVRKVYMKGIFKQATDSKYWELWNRQKLSSELELKQRRILELKQELTNKLIELERHFNSLEFNKFRENEGTQRNQRALRNWHGHSRQIQSLRSLHNTMTAQLAAAEQLSGCLSKQMAALSIQSFGKHDVKRQLFESIGLAYVGDTEITPARYRTFDTPANKEYSSASGSVAAKGQSRRNQSSFAKGCEPETARRRRDSFDRSWASFDPPKTTLKRILEEDNEKGSSNRSLLNISKQYFSPQSQKKSEVANSAVSNTSGAFQNHYQSKGFAETSAEQFTESPSTSSYLRTAGFQDCGVQMSSTKGFSALQAPSMLETWAAQNNELGAFTLADEKSKSSLPFNGKNYSFAASESKPVQQSDTSFHPLPSTSARFPEQSLTSSSESTESSDKFKFEITDSTSWDHQNTKSVSKTPLFDAKNSAIPTSALSSGANVSERGSVSKNSEKTSRTNDSLSASIPLQSVLASSSLLSSNNYPSPASLVSKSNSSGIFLATPKSSETSVVVKQEGSQPQPSVTSTMNFPSTLPSLTHGSNFSSVSSSSSIGKSDLLTSSQPSVSIGCSKTEGISEIQTKVDNMPLKTETGVKIETSASQPELPVSTSGFKHSASPALTELSTNSKSESRDDLGGSSKNLSVIKVEMTSATEAPSSVAVSNEGMDGSMRNVVPNSSHEEEMEEEVPETEQTTGFVFANLDGFGIGPIQTSTTPKTNLFGLGVVNTNTAFATSPYMMSGSSGELFRPASFSFQSPQPLQPTTVNFSGGFSSGGSLGQVGAGAGAGAGFGQRAQIGSGQQALGSVLGSFGQSRQIGSGVPGSNAAVPSGFGSSFTGTSAGGFGSGFATALSGGGFASLAAAGGGFAAAATAGGGGFAAAAGAVSGGGSGFGGFSNQQPSGGGFAAFGSSSSGATGTPPSQLFTQMRK